MPTLREIVSLALIVALVAACDDDKPRAGESDVPHPPSIAPSHGAFGQRVTLSGYDFGTEAAAVQVYFTAAAQGTMVAAPVALTSGSLEVLVPGAVAETAEVSVVVAGKASAAAPFTIDALADPTAEPGNELADLYAELDDTLVGLTSLLEGVVAPLLERSGGTVEAADVRTGAADLRAAFAEVVARLLATKSPEELALIDAVVSSDAMVAARAELAAAALALGVEPGAGRSLPEPRALIGIGDFSGSTVESIEAALRVLTRMRDVLDGLNDALIAAEIAAGGASLIPGFSGAAALIPVLEEIRTTIVKPILALLDTVIQLVAIAPTRAVEGSFEVRVTDNFLYLDQSFGSMASPVTGTGAFLVLEPYGVKGYVSFENDGGASLSELGSDLAPGLSRIGEAVMLLSGFDVGAIRVDSVEIKIRLISSDPEVAAGTWSDPVLWIEAGAPGLVDLTIRGDLTQVQESCASFGTRCIPASDIEITRSMHAVAGTQSSAPATEGPRLDSASVAGRPEGTAHLGDTLVITGAAFTRDPQLAHQDVHFEAAPGYPLSGLAWSTFQSQNDYERFETEVPDALPGPMTVWVDGHASNALDFTILPPRLDPPPPSGIVGEYWVLTGEGFSGTAAHNAADWAGFRSAPEAGDHHRLELVVPDGALSGAFRVVALDVLASQPYDVVARRFSEPSAISAPGRLGLRPAVAHDASTGNRVVAFIDRTAVGGAQLVASVVPAGADQVGTPVVLPAILGGHPAAPPRPAVAAAAGRYFVAWVEGGAIDRILLSHSDDGQSWSPAQTVSAHAGPSRQPALAADGSRVVVAWIDEALAPGEDAGFRFRVSNDGGSSFGGIWSSPPGDASDPAVAVAANAVVVAYSAADTTGRAIVVSRSEDGGVNFQAPWRLAVVGENVVARHPTVAVGPSCVTASLASVYVAWEQTVSDTAEDVLFARIDGTVLAAQNVSQTPEHSQAPSLTVDADCLPALAWLELGLSTSTLLTNGVMNVDQPLPAALRFARSFDAGLTFSPRPLTLASLTDGSRLGHLAMAGGGSALLTVVWQEDFGGAPVVAMRTTDGAGAAPSSQPVAPAGEISADLVYRGDNGGLWVSTPDGSRLQRLSSAFSFNVPGLSPDGRFIAYVPGLDRMLAAEADGAHPLGIAAAADFSWRGGTYWSPRGDFLAVGSPFSPPTLGWLRPDSSDFALVGTSSSIADVVGFSGKQPWSPDGRLVYAADGALGAVDPATGATETLSAALPASASAYYPSWSPDGAQLALVVSASDHRSWAQNAVGTGDVYLYDVVLGTLTQLTDSGLDTTPVWSPDGGRVAFVRGTASPRQVHVQAVDAPPGSDVNVSADLLGADDFEPVFLPDGTGVVMARRDPASGERRVVAIDIGSLAVTVLSGAFAGGPAVIHLGSRPTWAGDASAGVGATGATSVSLSWQGAADDVGVDHYEIWSGSTLLAGGISTTSGSVTGLTPDSAYTLTIRACDAAGNCSIAGPEVSFTTAAGGAAPTWTSVPPLLESTFGGTYDTPYSVSLSWTWANESDVEYRVYLDGAHVATRLYQGTMYDLTGLRPGQSYVAAVQACFVSGACTTDGPTYAFTTRLDDTPPMFMAGTFIGDQLLLGFSEPLDPASVPAASDFAVAVLDDTGSGVPRGVLGVAVEEVEKRVVLTMAQTLYAGDALYFSYTPGAAPLRNTGGLAAAEITPTYAMNLASLQIQAAATDAAGNLAVGGMLQGSARFGTHVIASAGAGDAFVAKRSASGQWLFAARLGGPGFDAALGVTLGAAGDVYVAGAFSGTLSAPALTANGASDGFVARLDTTGQWLWAARAGGVGTDMVPGGDSDVYNGAFVESAQAVAVDAAGNVYAGGKFGWTASFDASPYSLTSAGQTDIWVGKLDANGVWQWTARAGGDAGVYWAGDVANAVAVDAGGVYVAGAFQNEAAFPGLGYTLGVAMTPGSATPGLFVAKLATADGAWLWAADGGQMGGVGNALLLDGAGDVYAGGTALTFFGTPQPFVGKWSASGAPIWSRTVSGYGSIEGLGVDAAGAPFVAGNGSSGLDFDGSLLTSGRIFVAPLVPADGTFSWALDDGGSAAALLEVASVVGCGSGIVCVAGSAGRAAGQGSVTYQLGAQARTTGSEYDLFIGTAASTADVPPVGAWTALAGTQDPP